MAHQKIKYHGSPRRGTGFASHTKTLILGRAQNQLSPLPKIGEGFGKWSEAPSYEESTEKVHNVKWINNWTLLTGLLRNVKLLHIINVKYLRISLIFSTLAEKFSYARRLSANPVERICTHL